MVEKIHENVFRVEVPLLNNPLKALNSYLLVGEKRNLLIDTGFNRPECKEALLAAFAEANCDPRRTDLFITHVHADHSGLAGSFSNESNTVYCGAYTSLVFQKGRAVELWGNFQEMVVQSGLTGIELRDHPGYAYATEPVANITVVNDGDYIDLGGWKLRCIETSGHAPDHFVLYDEEEKILFSGDHILSRITPNNTIWGTPWEPHGDALGQYLRNLDKINRLELRAVFPAHRFSIEDGYQRIAELKEHHRQRLADILTIINDKVMCGAEVASLMKWDLRGRMWLDFTNAHKLFATGEALSHLTHLCTTGVLEKELISDIVYYRKIRS